MGPSWSSARDPELSRESSLAFFKLITHLDFTLGTGPCVLPGVREKVAGAGAGGGRLELGRG